MDPGSALGIRRQVARIVMEIKWWQLPGPNHFVDSIVQGFRSGMNAVLELPAHAPGGLREAIADYVRRNEQWQWRTLNSAEVATDGVTSLTHALRSRFVPETPGSEL